MEYLRSLTILFLILIVVLPYPVYAISATAYPSNLSSPIPDVLPGNDVFMEFFGSHPNSKNNTTIAGFIDTYGISGWSFSQAYDKDDRFEYDYVYPAANYSKQLVYLDYRPDSSGSNSSIVWVKLIERDEKLAPLSDNEARALGIDTGSIQIPTFTLSVAVISIAVIALIAILLLLIKPKRRR